MSSGHQKPCVVLRLGSPFLLGWLYRMTLYLMVGAELFFLDTTELSFIKCFHGDHSSKYQKITGGMVVFVFDWHSTSAWMATQPVLGPYISGPWESSDLNYGWEVHIVYLSREDKIIIVKFWKSFMELFLTSFFFFLSFIAHLPLWKLIPLKIVCIGTLENWWDSDWNFLSI